MDVRIFKLQKGMFLFADDDQVSYSFVDQSINKQRRQAYSDESYFTVADNMNPNAQKLTIKDLSLLSLQMPQEMPKMAKQFDDLNIQNQYVSSQQFLAILTDSSILVYALLKPYQKVA